MSAVKRKATAKTPAASDTGRNVIAGLAVERLAAELETYLRHARGSVARNDDPKDVADTIGLALGTIKQLKDVAAELAPLGGHDRKDPTPASSDIAWAGARSRINHLAFNLRMAATEDVRFAFTGSYLAGLIQVLDTHEEGKGDARTGLFMPPVANGVRTLIVTVGSTAAPKAAKSKRVKA